MTCFRTHGATPCKTILGTTRGLAQTRRLFHRNEDGSLVLFSLFTLIILILLAGIGVDVARHEALRTQLQNTLDRAVLAAANLDNTLDPKDVVEDYFAKAGLLEYLTEVKTEISGQGRRVTAYVAADIPTYFMKFAAIDELSLSSSGAAEQGLANLEISLVLDVSNSMNNSRRLTNLSNAGQAFAQTIFDNSAPDAVSFSVIPYSTQVNAGATILSELKLNDPHNYSHCINFSADDFYDPSLETKDIPFAKTYDQTVSFDPFYNGYYNSGAVLEVCDPKAVNAILPFSRSLSDVKKKIRSLVADGNTSIDLGVKWGAALLHPSARPLTQALINSGEVDVAMLGHPADDTGGTLKVLVVMTDGVNTTQYTMPESYRSGPSDMFLAPDGRVSFPTVYQVCGYRGWYYTCRDETRWYEPNRGRYYEDVYGGSNAVRLSWPEVWRRFTLASHANARRAASGSYNDYNFWMNSTLAGIENDAKDARLNTICSAAKANNILVFTVGFEVPYSAHSVLRNCASSPAHYYDVEGLEITDAFAAIATKVTELRLVE
nr:Tad domain-containing protein [uncultured Celeribacter sp.]